MTDQLYTGDTVQCDGEIGRVLAWRNNPREYEVALPGGRCAWYPRECLTLLRKMVVEPRPNWA